MAITLEVDVSGMGRGTHEVDPLVLVVNGMRFELTVQMRKLIEILAAQQGEFMTRHEITALLWPDKKPKSETAVDVAIYYLRNRVPGLIESGGFGQGWRMRPAPKTPGESAA